MATVTITHSTVTGAAANLNVLVDGPKWDANHVVTGLENVDNTSDATKNAAAVTLTNKTLTTPVINGLPTGTGVATANTASTLVARDGSGNFSAGTITASGLQNSALLDFTITGGTTQPLWDFIDNNTWAGSGGAMRYWGKDSGGAVQLGAIINGGLAVKTAGAFKGDIDFLVYGPGAAVQCGFAISGVYGGVVPTSDNLYELGDATLRWSSINAVKWGATAIASPGTPGAGLANVYVNSTNKNLVVNNDAGSASVTVYPQSAPTGQVVTGITSSGALQFGAPSKQYIMGGSGANATQFAAGTTNFITPALASTTESLVYLVIPSAGTFRNLFVYVQGSPGVGQTYVATFRNALADTAITCTISAGSNSASDLTHTATAAAGDRWSLKFVTSAGAAATNVTFAIEFDS